MSQLCFLKKHYRRPGVHNHTWNSSYKMLFIIVSDQYKEMVWLILLSETLLLWHTPVSTLTAILRMGRITSSTVLWVPSIATWSDASQSRVWRIHSCSSTWAAGYNSLGRQVAGLVAVLDQLAFSCPGQYKERLVTNNLSADGGFVSAWRISRSYHSEWLSCQEVYCSVPMLVVLEYHLVIK